LYHAQKELTRNFCHAVLAYYDSTSPLKYFIQHLNSALGSFLYNLHNYDPLFFIEMIQKVRYNSGKSPSTMGWRGDSGVATDTAGATLPAPTIVTTMYNRRKDMRNGSIEQQTVDQSIARIPGARDVLRGYHIDPTSRMSLAAAAAAASVVPDALLAELEERMRRMARRQVVQAPEYEQLQERAVGA